MHNLNNEGRLSMHNLNNEGRLSTYFIENCSYLKLRYLQLGYNLPRSVIQRINAKGIRIYVSGENLLTIKDTKGSDSFTPPDPENPGNAFPIPSRYIIGLDITF
jgi:hypothetical protein